MALEPPLLVEAVTGDTPISFSARQLRTLIDVFAFYEGVIGDNDLKVTQRGLGANMSVDVSTGSVAIRGDAIAYQGKYLMRNTSVVNVTITAAPPSGTRTDLVVAQLYDKQADGGTSYGWNFIAVPGPVGGVASLPPSAVPLAQVVVSSGQVSVVNSNITDVRYFAASFTNVQLVANNAGRPTSPRSGDLVFTRDSEKLNLWTGAHWTPYAEGYGGAYYGVPDTNGYLNCPHGLGAVPTMVVASINTNVLGGASAIPMSVIVDFSQFTATTFRVRVFDSTGAAYTQGVTIAYFARY